MSETEQQKSESEALAEQLAPSNPLRDFSEAYNESLAGDDESSAEKPTGDDDDDQSKKPPKKDGLKTLADLAKRLGVEASDLYAIEIPRANNSEPMTLGQLKDLMADHESHEVKQLEWEEGRRSREAELARAQQELEELYALLPQDALKPEMVAKMREKREAKLNNERQRTLEAIPEWRNDTTREKELGEIVEHLKDFGFPDTYLAHVVDHKTLRYIRENWLMHQRVKAALARVAEKKPTTPDRSSQQQTRTPRGTPRARTRTERQISGFMDTIHQAAKG